MIDKKQKKRHFYERCLLWFSIPLFFFAWHLYIREQARLKIENFYHSRGFEGKIEFESFSFSTIFGEDWTTVTYQYSEELGDEKVRITNEEEFNWSEILLPYYKGEMSPKRMEEEGRTGLNMLIPLIDKAVQKNDEAPLLKKKIRDLVSDEERLVVDRISYNWDGPARKSIWLKETIANNLKQGNSAFGGYHAIPLEGALARGIATIDFKERKGATQQDFEVMMGQLPNLNRLPDGIYRLGPYAGYPTVRIKDGQLVTQEEDDVD